MRLNDTIGAIATPRGMGGIAIIRLSGENAAGIAAKIVRPYNGKAVGDFESHRLTLCRIVAADKENFIIDEALVAYMRAPRSYTGENVVEINCHGGFLAADRILTELLKCGARLAEKGEFTRRAFINGKTDLSGAEAVGDLMNSSSEAGLHNAAMAMTGALAKKINGLRGEVMEIAAHISAVADYPEEVEPMGNDELNEKLSSLTGRISEMIDGFDTGRIMRDGVRTAIVGRPNVGKSSVLNAILKFDRAIVTDIPGTTRDTIEEVVALGGISLRLADTAGIRNSSDEVEKIGIERSIENIRMADLCLFVVDASEDISSDDIEIAKQLRGKKTILILNKNDKDVRGSEAEAIEKLGFCPDMAVRTSTPKGESASGIDELKRAIESMFDKGAAGADEVYLANERQRDSLLRAGAALKNASDGLCAGVTFDLLYIDMEDALTALGEVTGETVRDEIIEKVFENFCVGK